MALWKFSYLDFGNISDNPMVSTLVIIRRIQTCDSVTCVSAYLTKLVFSILRNMDCLEIRAVTLNRIRLNK